MEPIIDASHVYIRYLLGDFRDIGLKEWTIQKVKRERRVESRWSVEDISFTLEKGDFLGIIGKWCWKIYYLKSNLRHSATCQGQHSSEWKYQCPAGIGNGL